jgi:hypothetical protein
MIKPILTGVWVSAATMGAAYVGAIWQKPPATTERQHGGHQAANEMTPIRTRMISVPVVADGGIRGYVVAQFAFTAPAALVKQLPVKPDLFVVDEAFALIYAGDMIDFRQFKKQDLAPLGRKIAENVNKRLGVQVVEDVFLQELNYVPKDKVRGGVK